MEDKSEDVLLIGELDFGLLGMDVDVNTSGFAVDLKKAYREAVLHDCILICFVYRCSYGLVLDIPVVDIDALKAPVAPDMICLSRKTAEAVEVRLIAYGNQAVCNFFPVNGIYGIEVVTVSGCDHDLLAVLKELYLDMRIYHCKTFNERADIHTLG